MGALPHAARFVCLTKIDRAGTGKPTLWYPVGYGYLSEEHEGVLLDLFAVPVDGIIEVRLPKEEQREDAPTPENYTTHPLFVAYSQTARPDDPGAMHSLGFAWKHKDGNGIRVRLYAHPLDGRIDLVPAKTPEELRAGEEAAETA